MNTSHPVALQPLTSFRILVVDDNPAIHDDFRKILSPTPSRKSRVADLEAILFEDIPRASEHGVSFELLSAFQGQAALEMTQKALAENKPFAMAFVDVRMPPGWDGVETIARLWEVYPNLQVVLCTAYSDYSWEAMRVKLGQSANLVVLKKPFDNVEVQQLAHALTRKWELNLHAEMQLEHLENIVSCRTSELARANEALKRSEERFSKAFHTSPLAMGIQSLPEQRYVDVNDSMLQLTGYRRDQMLEHSAAVLQLWSQPQQVDEWLARLSRNEIVREQEAEVRDHNGNLRQTLVSLSLITLAGQPHLLVVIQDVTERVLLEQQLRQTQKMEAIGRLAAGVAHDFNNILTVIQGHAGLIQMKPEKMATAESAEEIAKAASRAAALVRQLLMFSRKQVMKFQFINLNDCINSSFTMVERLVGEHIRIQFRQALTIPSIHADPTMLEQIFMNLAVNARDAMPNGGSIAITTDVVSIKREGTSMDREKRDGQFVRLTFEDTGCGMDEDTANRIFEPFFTTKGVGKGTGLGLATVFGIVRQHNGWIEVSSKEDQGSVFSLYFPAREQEPEKTEFSSGGKRLLKGHETILVAEDEDALREMISLVLTTQGYKVITVASGIEALKFYEETKEASIELLVTDMVMPGGIMGAELADRLCKLNPKLKVIFTSGYSPGMTGKESSMRNFLPKPYSVVKLARFARKILDQPLPQATETSQSFADRKNGSVLNGAPNGAASNC